MSKLANLEFTPLDITGSNYVSWVHDITFHLEKDTHLDVIKEGNESSIQDKAKAMILIRRHIHENLKNEYLTVKEPHILWKNLEERYDHQKLIMLPQARYDWIHLRFQDFKSVNEYNSALLKITSKLILCGEKITDEEMLEKTLSTFHASDMLLQQQYRERRFTKYNELISCLLLSEQNNAVLLKNHHTRPTGSTPFPEANGVTYSGNNRGRGRGHGRGRGRGRGGRNNHWHRGEHNNKTPHHQKWNNNVGSSSHHRKWNKNEAGSSQQRTNIGKKRNVQEERNNEGSCFKCGMTNHWSRTCRTAPHLVDLYQASVKGKGKGVEINFASTAKPPTQPNINFVDTSEPIDPTHFDISDFFNDQDPNC